MGRKEALERIYERKNSNPPEIPHLVNPEQPTPIIIVSIKNTSERYGYTNPKREALKDRADTILQNPPTTIVNDAVDIYGEMIVASIASEGSVTDLNKWLTEPMTNSLAGDTKTSLRRLAISLDFANQIREKGENNDAIKDIFIQRQSGLQGLSIGTAIGRVGREDLGLIHEATDALAKGEKISTEISSKMKNFIIPDTERGH